jgi:hypothetical protein
LIDEKARQEATARKMPSDDAIDAIIGMSLKVREIGDDRDVLYAATTELLMCAAWRINELLNIAADSPRRETADGASRLGFAYGGSKGFEASIKWIPTNMVELAERAFADILRITEPSREVARFMEKHPGRAWLPEPWRLADRDTLITSNDIAGILGLSCAVVAVRWVKSKGIQPVSRKSTQGFYRIGDVEAAILKMQPKLPPGSPPLSSYLFLIPRWFTSDGDSMLPVVRFVSDGSFADFVVGRLEGRSIFERLDIRDRDGNAYAVRSHQIRHFLNNAAQEGRLSQLDIARWSGRKDVSQNVVYDHTGGMPLARTMRGLLNTRRSSRGSSTPRTRVSPAGSTMPTCFALTWRCWIGLCRRMTAGGPTDGDFR